MNIESILDQTIQQHNGYLIQQDVLRNENISNYSLARYIKGNHLERVAPGVYITEETWADKLYVLYLKNNGIVFSHETALYLHGLMEREPAHITATVKYGYNAKHLTDRGIQIVTCVEEKFETGKMMIQTAFGNTVPVYDRERTICDIIRRKDKMDIQIFSTAIKEYMRSKDKNLHNLMCYAKQFRIEKKVRNYTEVML